MGVFYSLFYLVLVIIWGDWRNWRKYYPTILFFITGDILYQWLFVDFYPMWKFQPYGIDDEIGVTHTQISLSIMIIKYPAIMLVYLYQFPKTFGKQFGYICLWTFIIAFNEWITLQLGGIVYDHGWTFSWSVLFSFVMLVILRIHHSKPLVAIAISIGFMLFLFYSFDVPTDIVFR
ncbi:hypothetical protein NC661_06565 [Aquibacillus koreensis]|uniref:Uncharacterized protein n=1 Tax=Aquibacillus koreensis TaxID=279446 RepID=A0A9X3WJF5_9BACI|nr:CBO0543 family protein [Aquibacillus koreensis]MCT2535687.1 hypothetical protein [Aquibacillus koreensis]MDC3420028.1 hypothetical protein [Aquibacillus koreensis]